MVIHIEDGLVQEVFAEDTDMDVVLIDGDIGRVDPDEDPRIVSFVDRNGRQEIAWVRGMKWSVCLAPTAVSSDADHCRVVQ